MSAKMLIAAIFNSSTGKTLKEILQWLALFKAKAE